MNQIPAEVIAAAPLAIAAILHLIKRLSAFDLEVRTYRERARARLLHERASRQGVPRATPAVTSHKQEAAHGTSTREALVNLWRATVASSYYEAPTSLRAEVQAKRLRSITEIMRRLLGGLWRAIGERATRERHSVQADVPAWVLALLDPEEADRCGREWGAHLHERIADGELGKARTDRRRFVRYALVLAITRHARRSIVGKRPARRCTWRG